MTAHLQTGPFKILSNAEKIAVPNSKVHQWPKTEYLKYSVFLTFTKNESPAQSDEQILSWSFFRKMAIFIQSKNPNQCRIFHKKMMQEHTSLDSLIRQLKQRIDRFEEWYQSFQPSLNNVKNCLNREHFEASKQPTKITKKVDEANKKLTYSNFQDLEDKIKDGQGPTDVGYQEDQIIQKPLPLLTFANKSARPAFGFSSFSQIEQRPNNDFDFFNRSSVGYPINRQKKEKQMIRQQWEDCHSSFINYVGKLSKLMNRPGEY